MPNYTYVCRGGHVIEHTCTIAEMLKIEAGPIACQMKGCNYTMEREYRPPQAPIRFKEGWYEHCGPEPVYCSSMGQLMDACEKGGTRSKYAQDMSTAFGRKEPRWV